VIAPLQVPVTSLGVATGAVGELLEQALKRPRNTRTMSVWRMGAFMCENRASAISGLRQLCYRLSLEETR
jgi:hypothetical protein